MHDASAPCSRSATIVSAAVKGLHAAIDHARCGSRIEREQVVLSCWNRRHVGDAAKVLQHAIALRVAEEDTVKHRHQRRRLPTYGHVRGTKVADDGQPGADGNFTCFADLPRAAQRIS